MPRKQQCPRRGLAEFRREHGARAELADHQLLDLISVGNHQLRGGWRVRLREADDKAVVAPHGFHVDGQLVPDARRHRHGPGGVDPSAERSEHADAPVAQIVEDPLDHHGSIVGHHAGGIALVS